MSLGLLAAVQIALAVATPLMAIRLVGVGPDTDAFVAAQAVPVLLTAIVGASLQSVWLPRFTWLEEEHGHRPKDEIAAAQGLTLVVTAGLAVAVCVSAPVWLPLYLPGFDENQRLLAMKVLVLSSLAAVVTNQSNVLVAALRVEGRLASTDVWASVCSLLALPAVVAAVPVFGIIAVPVIAIGRALLLHLILSGLMQWPGLRLRRNGGQGEVAWRTLGHVFGAASIIKAAPLVDRYWGSLAPGGALTMFNIAYLGIGAVSAVLERMTVASVLPEYSRRAARFEWRGLHELYVQTLMKVGLGVAAVGLLAIGLQASWQQVLQQLLLVTPAQAEQVWLLAVALVPGAFVLVAGTAAVGVFYAMNDTRTPLKIGLGAFATGLAIKALFFYLWGILGLAVAVSGYLALSMLGYHIGVVRRLRSLR